MQSDCVWCFDNAKCGYSSSSTCSITQFTCPSITTLYPPSSLSGQQTQVTIHGGPFLTSDQYSCNFGGRATVPATWINSSSLVCTAPNLETGAQVQLSIENKGVKYAGNTVTFYYYDCNQNTCGNCLNPINTQCGWCPYDNMCIVTTSPSSTCSIKESLLINHTECPVVHQIVPDEGNLLGGTLVSVLGNNFRVGNSLSVKILIIIRF